MKSCTTFAAGFLLLLTLLPSSSGSLLPILDRHGSSLSDRYADPSRILEHIPFGLDRDELAAVAHDRVDWKETPDAHLIMIDVPGLKKDDLKVEVDNGVLRVSGERKREEEKKGEHWHCVERAHGKFWRLFRLPNNVHLDSVQETLEDGVLTVRLPKLSPDKVKGPKVVSIAGREEEKGKLGAAETKKDSVQATLEDGVLTVRLPKLSPDKVKGPKVVSIARREEEKGKLGAAETKKATLEDGVLTVRLPKLSPDKVKGPKVVSITGREEEKGKLGAAETKKVDL